MKTRGDIRCYEVKRAGGVNVILKALSVELWPVRERPGQVANKNEVKRLRKRPFVLDIIDVEFHVGWGAGKLGLASRTSCSDRWSPLTRKVGWD